MSGKTVVHKRASYKEAEKDVVEELLIRFRHLPPIFQADFLEKARDEFEVPNKPGDKVRHPGRVLGQLMIRGGLSHRGRKESCCLKTEVNCGVGQGHR